MEAYSGAREGNKANWLPPPLYLRQQQRNKLSDSIADAEHRIIGGYVQYIHALLLEYVLT
jgi:hypothetical protein